MRDYTNVVSERYNNCEENISIYDNIYSQINNTGLYMHERFREQVCKIFRFLKSRNIDFIECKILDVGCGAGDLLRFIAELKGGSDNLYGYDLSEYRIQKAKNLNPNIKYSIGDITKFKIEDLKFDIIFAVDVFMHLNSLEQIKSSLDNIKNMLSENGVFIWYDAYWDNHFNSANNADSCGYNPNEMEQYSKQAGFEKIYYDTVFKYLDNKVNYSTAYMGDKYPFWFIEMMEEKIPGLPVNAVMIFKKSNNRISLSNYETSEKISELEKSILEAIVYIKDNINTVKSSIILELLNNCKQALEMIHELTCCEINYLFDDIALIESIIKSENNRGIERIIKIFSNDFSDFINR